MEYSINNEQLLQQYLNYLKGHLHHEKMHTYFLVRSLREK